MCDWKEVQGVGVTTGYCLVCERQAAERKKAVQAFAEKAAGIVEHYNAVFAHPPEMEANEIARRIRALAAEGGDALQELLETKYQQGYDAGFVDAGLPAREGKEPK